MSNVMWILIVFHSIPFQDFFLDHTLLTIYTNHSYDKDTCVLGTNPSAPTAKEKQTENKSNDFSNPGIC